MSLPVTKNYPPPLKKPGVIYTIGDVGKLSYYTRAVREGWYNDFDPFEEDHPPTPKKEEFNFLKKTILSVDNPPPVWIDYKAPSPVASGRSARTQPSSNSTAQMKLDLSSLKYVNSNNIPLKTINSPMASSLSGSGRSSYSNGGDMNEFDKLDPSQDSTLNTHRIHKNLVSLAAKKKELKDALASVDAALEVCRIYFFYHFFFH